MDPGWLVVAGFAWALWLGRAIGRYAARKHIEEVERLARKPSLEERWRELTERVAD